eukprot:7999739-Alexandrium_andersonii.AAC.1
MVLLQGPPESRAPMERRLLRDPTSGLRAPHEESTEAGVLTPLLDAAKLKPERQGCQRLQMAIASGASASVIPD